MGLGSGIPDPGSEIRDPEKTYSGSRIQGSKRHRIPDPDPQHWFTGDYVRRALVKNYGMEKLIELLSLIIWNERLENVSLGRLNLSIHYGNGARIRENVSN
jgi:hypothetical protein